MSKATTTMTEMPWMISDEIGSAWQREVCKRTKRAVLAAWTSVTRKCRSKPLDTDARLSLPVLPPVSSLPDC
jgi:hypothetical protein